MRAPPEGLVAVDRAALLDAIRARLGVSPSPGDPAWLIIEEIARFAEATAGRLDALPAELLQAAASQIGVALQPALPALAIIVATPKAEGALLRREDVDATTFVAPRGEARGPISFVPCEPRVHLVPGEVTGWLTNQGGELFETVSAPSGSIATPAPTARSTAFAGERVRYRVRGADPVALRQELERAFRGMAARRIGWLRFELQDDPDGVTVLATIDPAATLRRVATRSASVVIADWGQLDDLAWRPSVEVTPRLSSDGESPVNESIGEDSRTLEITGLRWDEPLDGLLVRTARSAPHALVDAIWRTLQGQALSLPPAPTSARRELAGPAAGGWIEAVLRAGLWPPLRAEGSTYIVIQPRRTGADPDTVRFALAFEDGAPSPRLRLLTRAGDEVHVLPDDAVCALWRVPVAAPDGSVHQVMAWDATIPPGVQELVVGIEGQAPALAALNALLAINAPRVREGLRVPIRGLKATTVQLRGRDLVTPAVLSALHAGPLYGSWLPPLLPEVFALARFAVDGSAAIDDTRGVRVDEVAGQVTLMSVDAAQDERALLPGQVVEITWYRRTDGASGVLPAGTVSAFEQLAVERTILKRAQQPYPTVGGRGAERASGAMLRTLVPTQLSPILPAEFERDALIALGAGYERWSVRVYTLTDAVVSPTWPWTSLPGPSQATTPSHAAFAAPGVLHLGLCDPHGQATEDQLNDVRLRLRGWFERARRRTPSLSALVVTALRPLTLTPMHPFVENPALPLYDLDSLCRADRLTSTDGEERRALPVGRLGDAVIVRVERPASLAPWSSAELTDWLNDELGLAGITARALVWTPEDIARLKPVAWCSLAQIASPALQTSTFATPTEPDPGRLNVALGHEGRTLSADELTELARLVDRWEDRVRRRRGGASGPVIWPLRVVRRLRTPVSGLATDGLEDAWGEVRERTSRPLLDAVLDETTLSDQPSMPAAVDALSSELERTLRRLGWRWRARVWLTRYARRMALTSWSALPPSSGPAVMSGPSAGRGHVHALPALPADRVILALGPPSGLSTPAERASVERAALRWWAGVAPLCPGVGSPPRLETLRPLRARTSDMDHCPTGMPTTWTGALADPDRLIDHLGEVRTPLPRHNLIDALLTSVDPQEDHDEV